MPGEGETFHRHCLRYCEMFKSNWINKLRFLVSLWLNDIYIEQQRHVRSNSLPSGPHPLAAHVDEQLCRFRSSESTSTSSSSITQQLNGLQDLHSCIEKMLHLPLAQDSLSQDQNKKAVDVLLDESLRLLDICSITKDALSQMKDSLNEIQSVLRRKREDVSLLKKYLNSRKTLKKTIQKLLKSLKVSKNMSNEDETLTMLEEAQEVTATVFGSLLCFISERTGWMPSGGRQMESIPLPCTLCPIYNIIGKTGHLFTC